MNFEKQIQKDYGIFQKSLFAFVILVILILGAFIYWLQSEFGLLSIL